MGIIEKLVSGYPKGDVTPQDFIDHLTIGADGWAGAWIAIGLAVVFGLLVLHHGRRMPLLRHQGTRAVQQASGEMIDQNMTEI